ncbi:arginine deiminase-related protein, partial [Echinicola jeungdonensis]|uniref:arginine deiminase-related protein n=1 Tax=Echinicola jeungdonensis TaxID=709343 RepID=UPI0025B311C7
MESTGSLVMDRGRKHVYACLSQRTHPVPLAYFCRLMGFEETCFTATYQKDGNA